MPRMVLASASPARLRLLQAAGINPEVIVSHVDEDDVDPSHPAQMVSTLARRKTDAVAARCHRGELVLGCDSTLEVNGRAYGKPASAQEAIERWLENRGQTATLLTGHHLIDTSTGRRAEGVAATVVHFGRPTDQEIEAYVATGEPLAVAGAFTLDGRSAAFIAGVDGDPSNVIGCSLPLVRTLTGELGISWTSLWA